MQIVYILGDNRYIEMRFQSGQQLMCFIRLGIQTGFSALVVEIEHQLRVFAPSLRRSYFHDVMAFPKPVLVAKSSQAALRADAGTGKNDKLLHIN